MTHVHEFNSHCGMSGWTICSCGLYGPETQDLLNHKPNEQEQD